MDTIFNFDSRLTRVEGLSGMGADVDALGKWVDGLEEECTYIYSMIRGMIS